MNREIYGALIGVITLLSALLPTYLMVLIIGVLSLLMARELSGALEVDGLEVPAFLSPALFWVSPAVGGIFIAIASLLRGYYSWNIEQFLRSSFILFYVGFFPSYLIGIREEGSYELITLILTIWAHDVSAYYFGRKFGKKVLLERLSPKKTIEGYIAGFTAGLAVFLLLQGISLRSLITGSVILLAGAMGDYFKSFIKRQKGIKDFSSTLGEHGGFVDRFDALVFSAPVYLWLAYRT